VSFVRYEAYKDSEVEWLGEVPERWKIIRLKDLGFLQNGISKGGDYFGFGFPFISYGNVYNNTISPEKIKTYANSTLEDQQAYSCKKGDIFFTRTSETIEEIGFSATCLKTIYKSVFSGFVIRFRPTTKELAVEFSKFYFSANILRDFFSKQVAIVTRASLSQGLLNQLSVILPSLVEQAAIAAFLDTRTAQIDRQIDLLSQKAAQYGKLKKSLINETVTCGLDKSVPMKDSGVEWIGEVPAHWDMKRLKELSDIQNSIVDKKSHEHETPVQLCNYVDVYKNEFINASLDFMWATADKSEIKRFCVRKHDVFITKDSETCDDIAIPALATESLENVLCGYHLARFRTNEKLLFGAYLFRLFQSKDYGFRFVIAAKGITRVGLGQSAIADSATPVPPLQEQIAIAAYLDSKTAQIDSIVATITSQIDKLKELRKTLINDVVTGKIRVA